MTDYYPFILRAIPKEKVWGGRNLEKLVGKSFASKALIGETWETWDENVIENGGLRGMTLGAVIERDPEGVLGATSRAPRLPLLFKYLDAQDDLSVQVHPDDATAQVMENYPFGKTEAWYIIHAEPNAALIHGFKPGANSQRVRAALARGALQELLEYVPVKAGDVIFVPAGTVHAITRGIVLAEIQENSDITYRFYDWGRVGKGRDLHIEQSLQVARFDAWEEHQIPRLAIQQENYTRHFLTACKYFSFELIDLQSAMQEDFGARFNIISLLHGGSVISYGARFVNSLEARWGQTFLLPARLGRVQIAPTKAPCQFLRAYVPDLGADVVQPLRRAGIRAQEIARLGGAIQTLNDLIPALKY